MSEAVRDDDNVNFHISSKQCILLIYFIYYLRYANEERRDFFQHFYLTLLATVFI